MRDYLDVEKNNSKDPMMRGRSAFMFYPVHGDDPERAQKFISYVAAGLRDARTYQVTAEMTDAVDGMYQATKNRVSKVSSDEIVAPAGFAWFDKPWMHTDLRGKRCAIRAISWAPQHVRWEGGGHEETDGTRVCHWTYRHDDDDYREGREQLYDGIYNDYGDLILAHVYVWPHGVRFATVGDGGDKIPDDMHASELDADVALVGRPEGTDDPMAWLHALWMLLDAEISVSTRAPLDRPARRRALRSLRHDDVQVITLRRARHAERGEDYEPVVVDWSCRWLVQGHWRHVASYAGPRHHFVPSHHRGGQNVICQTCDGKGAWVRPYVKGPDNMPMRHIDQVWRLSR
jgi:hypothetical protein